MSVASWDGRVDEQFHEKNCWTLLLHFLCTLLGSVLPRVVTPHTLSPFYCQPCAVLLIPRYFSSRKSKLPRRFA